MLLTNYGILILHMTIRTQIYPKVNIWVRNYFFFSKFIADTILQLYSCSVHLTPANQWNFVPSEMHFCHHPILICLPYCPKHNWMLRKSYIGEVLCHEQLMPLCNCLVPTLHSICLVMMWVGVINNCLHEHIFSFFNQLIASSLY